MWLVSIKELWYVHLNIGVELAVVDGRNRLEIVIHCCANVSAYSTLFWSITQLVRGSCSRNLPTRAIVDTHHRDTDTATSLYHLCFREEVRSHRGIKEVYI